MFVGALMPGIRRGDVHTGFLLSAPDTTQVTRAVRARARVIESAVFGRRHPIFRGYSPALYAHTARARCFLEPDEEMVMPGEGCEFTVYLSRAIALSPGQRFVLRDNNTIMAIRSLRGATEWYGSGASSIAGTSGDTFASGSRVGSASCYPPLVSTGAPQTLRFDGFADLPTFSDDHVELELERAAPGDPARG